VQTHFRPSAGYRADVQHTPQSCVCPVCMLAPGVPPAKAPRPQACMPAVCALLGAPTTPARIEQACSHVCICARACTWRTFEMVELSQAWRCQLILGKVDVFLRGKCRRKTKCAAPLEVWLLTNAFTRACTRTHTLVYSRTISHTHTYTLSHSHTHSTAHSKPPNKAWSKKGELCTHLSLLFIVVIPPAFTFALLWLL